MEEEKEIQQEIFTYTAPGLIYSSNWSIRPDRPYRLAFGSFSGSGPNFIDVIQLNRERNSFVRVCGIEHPYPATKLAWLPDRNAQHTDLLATTSDYLRLYSVEGGNLKLKSVLTGVCELPFSFLTSFRTRTMNLLRLSLPLIGMRFTLKRSLLQVLMPLAPFGMLRLASLLFAPDIEREGCQSPN